MSGPIHPWLWEWNWACILKSRCSNKKDGKMDFIHQDICMCAWHTQKGNQYIHGKWRENMYSTSQKCYVYEYPYKCA
jgi:hypothetical protein